MDNLYKCLKAKNSSALVYLDVVDYEYLQNNKIDIIEVYGLKNSLKTFNVINPISKNSVSLALFLFENLNLSVPFKKINDKDISYSDNEEVYDYRISNFKNVIRKIHTVPKLQPHITDINNLLNSINNISIIYDIEKSDIYKRLIKEDFVNINNLIENNSYDKRISAIIDSIINTSAIYDYEISNIVELIQTKLKRNINSKTNQKIQDHKNKIVEHKIEIEKLSNSLK